MEKKQVFVLFLFIFSILMIAMIVAMIFSFVGCKKAEKEINETTLMNESAEIEQLLNELETVDIEESFNDSGIENLEEVIQ